MIGSSLQQNFGESVRYHGFGIYDVTNDDYTFVDLKNKKPFLSFKVTSYEDILNGKEQILNY